MNQACLLACDRGEPCPEGMACVTNHALNREFCAWVIEGQGCGEDQLHL